MKTILDINKEVIERLQIEQYSNWTFCVKLMSMLRNKEISTADTNMDIYKKVIGAIAKDNMDEYERKQEVFETLIKEIK